MEKLTLEHIAPFLPYGLNATTKECGYKLPENGIITSWQGHGNIDEQIVISTGDGYYLSSVEKTVPILRSMNLAQPITVDGKEIVPIVELAKMHFPNYQWEITNRKYVVCGESAFEFSENGFYYWDKDGQVGHIPNQIVLFKWLYAHKFDVDGLIEKGLAIDVNTLETNPYETA